MSSNGLLKLPEVRAQAAAALAPASEADPPVFMDIVDSLDPPAILLLWADPWLEPRTIGSSYWDAQLEVRCLASRVEPGPGVEKLEALVTYTIERLLADSYTWPAATLAAPRIYQIGGIPLLGARVRYRVPVTI